MEADASVNWSFCFNYNVKQMEIHIQMRHCVYYDLLSPYVRSSNLLIDFLIDHMLNMCSQSNV